MSQKLKNWIGAVISVWVCSSSLVLADELPATVRFLNVVPSDDAPAVEVKGFPKVDLVLGRAVGPIGLRQGDYQMTFMFAGKETTRAVKLEAGRGKLFIIMPKLDDASKVKVMEFQALHRDDLVEAGEGKCLRFINVTAGDIEIETAEGRQKVKMGGEHIFTTKKPQLPLTVGDEVVAIVDLRDLSVCSVVFYVDAENKLASVILPEPITSSDNDEQ